MAVPFLTRVTARDLLTTARRPVAPEPLGVAVKIVEDVRTRGAAAVRDHCERLGDLRPGDRCVFDRAALERALEALPEDERALLERTAQRIRRFAAAQRECLAPLDTEVPGGRAGHRWLPVSAAGAYAPGGRYPLPSSVLMTVIPARVAGVDSVWVASPRPAPVTLAAAAIAGADGLLAIGGAQAMAALAFGTHSPAVDVLVGPGNRFVTAAKKHLFGEVGIDGLAGPSELVVIADEQANPRVVAADLLAQAEHDVDASAILIATSEGLVVAVEAELLDQLRTLATATTAAESLRCNGRAVVVDGLDQAATIANHLAPEHLELLIEQPDRLASELRNYGGLFIGHHSAEVFGDYGIGPNHVLPTGRGARFQAGLSVATFLRPATWLQLRDATEIADDAARLARIEGLEAHARAAWRE